VIIDFWVVLAAVGGAILGYGIYLVLALFRSPPPALGPALRRLHSLPAPAAAAIIAPGGTQPVASPPVVSLGWIDLPQQDLHILNRSAQSHILTVALAGLAAMLVPGLVTVAVVILRLPVPPAVPVAVTLVLAIGSAYLAHREMRSRARAARAEFVRALCTYVTLTAHQVRSGHGAVEAMERAARICQGWPYARLRSALLTAQLQMTPPWDELRAVADATGVVELAGFADIMRSAGTDGAQVYQTLRAQGDSLRDQIRVIGLETAKRRTSKLDIPSTMLIMILLVLLIYPIMVGLFQQT
jgi:type II secretion system (T2SS) protein F